MNKLSMDKVNNFVLRKQHLTDDSQIDEIVQIVKDISGLHATGSIVPFLSLFARTRNFVKENLNEELYVKRNLGRIRCMRGTIYILAKEMIPIAYAATRKMLEKSSRRYAEFRGVSSEKCAEVSKSILKILKDREMTASEIKKTLKTQLDVSAILYLMCDQGLIVRSKSEKGWKDKNQKYSLFEEYFPDIDLNSINETEAITLLVKQYLRSFGPATENDIAWWTGLGKMKVQEALNKLQGQIAILKISDAEGRFLAFDPDKELVENTIPEKKQTVNLLPTLDPYLMGYKERKRYLHPTYYDKVFDRSGNATSTILIDGKVVGVWDFAREPEPLVKIHLFEEGEVSVLREIYLKAQRIGKFIADEEVQIKECDFMIPLTQRTAGGVMSPLKGC